MRWLRLMTRPTAPRGVPAKILAWLALILMATWLLARWWGITDDQRITSGQRKLLIASAVLYFISRLPLPRFPKFTHSTKLALPTSLEVSGLALLAALITCVDIAWSLRAGQLAYPPFYDGISYIFDSKRTIYLLSSWFENPEILRTSGAPNFTFTPFWKILMMAHHLVFGIGEWQSYTVRFWPTLLLLYLIHWMVGQVSNRRIAWIAVACSAMLPTLSASVRSTLLQFYFPWSYTNSWYLTDLRPDLLFAVLLTWATVPLVHFAKQLDSRLWFISGTFAALALMTKPSALTLLILAWGSALLMVLFVNREKLREILESSLWGFGPFLLLIFPWIVLGGPARIIRYVYRSAVSQRELWSNPNATLGSELTYYWSWFSIHMGPVEGWLFLACGLVAFGWTVKNNLVNQSASSTLLIIATLLYGIVSISPSKNYFLGLPFFLILWIFAWLNLAQIFKGIPEKSPIASRLLPTVTALYVVFTLSAFCYAVKRWPVEHIRIAAQTRMATEEVIHDLKQRLTRSDRFLSAPLYGVPATFQFHMIQRDGYYPRQCGFDPLTSPPERVVEGLGPNCKAILLYSDNQDQVKFANAPKPALIRWEAIAKWVKNPASGYRLVQAYRFSSQTPYSGLIHASGSFTMELYVLDKAANSGEGS